MQRHVAFGSAVDTPRIFARLRAALPLAQPDRSPALARRPLAAGQFGSLALFYTGSAQRRRRICEQTKAAAVLVSPCVILDHARAIHCAAIGGSTIMRSLREAYGLSTDFLSLHFRQHSLDRTACRLRLRAVRSRPVSLVR